MIGYPTNLTSSGQIYHTFCPSYFTYNDTSTIQTVIIALRVQHNIVWECCGRLGHKYDALIICGPNFLPPILSRNMNQVNTLHDDERTDPPRKYNSQPSTVKLKFRTFPHKTRPVVLDSMGMLNHHDIYNGDVKI